MSTLKQYWPALRSALEEVITEISGSPWKGQESDQDLTAAAAMAITEDARAVCFEAPKLPGLGTVTLAFSVNVAAALATLMAGEAPAQAEEMEETVFEFMRQVAGRMTMKLEECAIVPRWCEPASSSNAFELRAEGRSAMAFGVAFDASADPREDCSAFDDIGIDVRLRFGSRDLTLAEILEFSPGDVIELQQRLEEPADLLVGERVFARGEVVLIDGNYGLRVTELVARSMA